MLTFVTVCVSVLLAPREGKSTMVDPFTGFLAPSAGRMLVNCLDLHDPEHKTDLKISVFNCTYTPGRIYLTESSIDETLSLGPPVGS